ncbi:M15 family metallopeptidase [Marinobacter hydrocarbonoclasticus]|nr:M15 family metallopeptidase [Marinobacter nauticus]
MNRTAGLLWLLLFSPSLAAAAASPTAPKAHPEFVPLSAVAPQIVQELRYAGDNNFVGGVVAGYEQARCLLTLPAAEALARVQKRAEDYGLGLKVYDCYRPQHSVDHFVRWARDEADTRMASRYYPEVPKSRLFELGYIAARSGHSRGSTVDLTLVQRQPSDPVPGTVTDCRKSPQEGGSYPSLPMGSGYDCFDPVSHTAYSGLTQQARSNRLLLLLLMESEGFVNYDKEWWHFTLRDEPYPDHYFDQPLNESDGEGVH